jgi:hypothetical protein
LNRKEVLETELAINLAQHLAGLIVSKTILKEDVPIIRLLQRANEIVASI